MTHLAVLSREKTGLVIIDYQGKLFSMVWNRDSVLANAKLMIQAAGIYDIPIILTEHYPKGLGRTDPAIRELIPKIEPFEKVVFSAFGSKGFERHLGDLEIETIIIMGIETHICISQTVHDALDRDYRVHVLADAVSARTEQNHNIGIEKMRDSGAIISSTEMALYEIQYQAGNNEFKQLLKLVK